MEHIIISHDADPDGITSAALAAYELRRRKLDYELRFAGFTDVRRTIEELSSSAGKEIHWFDIALNGPREGEHVNQQLVDDDAVLSVLTNNTFHYIEHHPLNPPSRRALLEEHSATFKHTTYRQCAAILALNHFARKSSPAHRFLARVGQATDYAGSVKGEENELAWQLNRVLTPQSGLRLEDIAHALTFSLENPLKPWQEDGQLTGILKDAYQGLETSFDEARAQLKESITHHTINGLKVVCAFAPRLLYMKEGTKTIKNACPDADLYFLFYDTKAVVADQRGHPDETQLPLLPYCRLLGGGGRNNCGGWHCIDDTTADTYEDRRDQYLYDFAQFCQRMHTEYTQ